MTRARHASWVAALACALLCLLAVPVAAQQPYPPSPPPDPPTPELELTCEVDDDRVLTCEGEGYLPDSTVTVEVRSESGDVLVELEVEVGPDGTFTVPHPLPCAVASESVVVSVSGRDSQDRPTVETRTLEVPPAPDCDPPGQGRDDGDDGDGVEGARDDVQGAPDGGGSLAFTGRNLLILALVALVVLALGTALVRSRRRQGDDAA